MTGQQNYTPSEDEVRADYVAWDGNPARGEKFDAWLAARDARVRRDAAREAWTDCVSEASALGWLHAPAALDMLGRNPYETETTL